MKGKWSISPVRTYKNMHADGFWDPVTPSKVPIESRPAWMTYDDAWVAEVRRGLKACAVFLYMPLCKFPGGIPELFAEPNGI
jgi:proton-dependent oligopeptide transporter, POT family